MQSVIRDNRRLPFVSVKHSVHVITVDMEGYRCQSGNPSIPIVAVAKTETRGFTMPIIFAEEAEVQ